MRDMPTNSHHAEKVQLQTVSCTEHPNFIQTSSEKFRKQKGPLEFGSWKTNTFLRNVRLLQNKPMK